MTLEQKLEHSEKMRDLQAEYACKLEEKLHSIECILTSESIEYSVRVEKALAKIRE